MNSAVTVISTLFILAGAAIGYLTQSFLIGGILVVIGIILGLTLRTAAEWERAVVLRLGRFAGIRGPGLYFLIPAFENVYAVVDTRRYAKRQFTWARHQMTDFAWVAPGGAETAALAALRTPPS